MYTWQVGQRRPLAQVTEAPLGDGEAEFYATAGRLFAWNSGATAPFVADPRTHSFTQRPLRLGFITGSGKRILIQYGGSSAKAGRFPQAISSVLTVADLPPLSSCLAART